jgi:hypothetical protein
MYSSEYSQQPHLYHLVRTSCVLLQRLLLPVLRVVARAGALRMKAVCRMRAPSPDRCRLLQPWESAHIAMVRSMRVARYVSVRTTQHAAMTCLGEACHRRV